VRHFVGLRVPLRAHHASTLLAIDLVCSMSGSQGQRYGERCQQGHTERVRLRI
jgi:hypothetical protein